MSTESILDRGYKVVPNFSKYAINDKGVLRNITSEKIISWVKTKPRPEKKVTGGYYITNIHRDDGVRTGVSRHRLLALLFLERPSDFETVKYTVNHVNGIPGDDWLDNLEWKTYSGNLQHAYDTGLMHRRLTPVIVRNLKDNTEIKYPSAYKAAREIDLPETNIHNRLKNANGIAYDDGLQIKRDDDSEWTPIEELVRTSRQNKDCVLIDLEKKTFTLYSSVRSAEMANGIKVRRLYHKFCKNDDAPLDDRWIIKSLDDCKDPSKYITSKSL